MNRLREVQPHQLAPFLLEVGHAGFRERLQRAGKWRPRSPGSLGDTPLLSTIAGKKDDDAVGFTEPIGTENERIRSVQGHKPCLFYFVWSVTRPAEGSA